MKMSASVKKQILEAIRQKLEGAKGGLEMTKVNRRRGVDLESRDRSIDYVIGDEVVVEQDTLGYTMEFPVNLKVTWRTETAAFDKAEDLKAALQGVFESDAQLGGLANAIEYDGEADLSKNDNWSAGCFVLAYTVQYRRKKGEPAANY
jgi:hypothetical protein